MSNIFIKLVCCSCGKEVIFGVPKPTSWSGDGKGMYTGFDLCNIPLPTDWRGENNSVERCAKCSAAYLAEQRPKWKLEAEKRKQELEQKYKTILLKDRVAFFKELYKLPQWETGVRNIMISLLE